MSGLFIYPNSSKVQFSSDAGFGSDSSLEEILGITGYNAYHGDKDNMHYVRYYDGEYNPEPGQYANELATVRIETADDVITVREIGLSLGFSGDNPLVIEWVDVSVDRRVHTHRHRGNHTRGQRRSMNVG